MQPTDSQAQAASVAVPAAPGRRRDYHAGGLMILLGLYAAGQGLRYGVGTMTRMGPGFFPMSIGVILAGVGVVIAFGQHLRRVRPLHAMAPPQGAESLHGPLPDFIAKPPTGSARVTLIHWRAWTCMILSVIAFIVLGRHGGLLPASFAVVFIAALGDAKNGWRQALTLALGICVLCVIVFWWALQVQMPLLTWGD